MAEPAIVLEFSIPMNVVPEEHRQEAERKAREAFVMSLLRQGDISAGRAAEELGIDRWTLGELMSAYDISPFDEHLTPAELAGELDKLG
jgi:DNA-binding NtrC family response regulator